MAYVRLGAIREPRGKGNTTVGFSQYGSKSVGLYKCINYIFNPLKTNDRQYVGGYNISLGTGDITKNVFEEMLDTKKCFGKEDGVQGYHYKLSFPQNDKVTPEMALQITYEFCQKCFPDYECAYAVHDNTKYLHSHIVFNSVDMFDGYKYQYKNGDWAKKLMPAANEICKKYGLSELDLSLDKKFKLKHKCKSYNKWLKDNKKPDSRLGYTNAMIRCDIDECIAKAETYEEFKKLMKDKGHVVDDSKKHMTVLAPGRERPCRTYSLTPDKCTYTKENIMKMINGTYLDRDAVKEKLMQDWNAYNTEKVKLHIARIKPEVARMAETKNFQASRQLFTMEDIDTYRDYLNRADKELNIMKKYVQRSLDARRDALEELSTLVSLIPYVKRYNDGDKRFSKEYEQSVLLRRRLAQKGYNTAELYTYQKTGEQLIRNIVDFKKHIFVEKKICDRIEKVITGKADMQKKNNPGNESNASNRI